MGGELEYRIGKLELRPGDVVVVKVDRRHLTPEVAQRLHAAVRTALSDDERNKVLILDAEVELSVLTKAEIEARTK